MSTPKREISLEISRILNKLQLKCGEIMSEFSKNSENNLQSRETLFSETCIWSNICRIWMKSGWSERSSSVGSDLFYSVFVERFAVSQIWFDLHTTGILVQARNQLNHIRLLYYAPNNFFIVIILFENIKLFMVYVCHSESSEIDLFDHPLSI